MPEPKTYYLTGEVAKMIGISDRLVRDMFDAGYFSGYRRWGSSDRRISRASILRYAHQNRIVIPQIGMFPYAIMTLGLDRVEAEAVSRAAASSDAVVNRTDSPTEFGILIQDGLSCCGVVGTSIGLAWTRDVAKAVRRHEQTESMLLIAVADAAELPVGLVEAGYDQVFRRPFPPANLVRRITRRAKEYQDMRKVAG